MVLCNETENNTALAESLVKGLVAGDSMSVRQLYAKQVQFTPRFKLVMAGNHKPIVRGNDTGNLCRLSGHSHRKNATRICSTS